MRSALEVMTDLAQSGLNAEQIALVMELSATVAAESRPIEDKQALRRRERDRAYQAERRQNQQTSADSDDVAGQVFLDKKEPQTPEKIKPIPCVRETRARGWHRLPEGWRPTKSFPVPLQAKVDQWPPGALNDEIAGLKRWAANAEDKNGKGRKLDWDKALWNWLGRRHDERYSRQQQPGLRRARPNLTDLIRATSGPPDIEHGGGTRGALPAIGYG